MLRGAVLKQQFQQIIKPVFDSAYPSRLSLYAYSCGAGHRQESNTTATVTAGQNNSEEIHLLPRSTAGILEGKESKQYSEREVCETHVPDYYGAW